MAKLSKKTDLRQQRLPLSLVPQAPKKWQSYLKKQRQKRWLKSLMITLGAVFVLGLIMSVFRLGWWLGQPLSQSRFTSLEAPRWSGKNQLNVLVTLSGATGVLGSEFRVQGENSRGIQEFFLVSLNPPEGTLKILIFPPDLKIPDTKGVYTLSELLTLAGVQNPPQGIDFVIESLENYLAIPIDGYVVANTMSSKLEEIITQAHRGLQSPLVFLKTPVIINFIKKNLSTNLTPGQMFRVIGEMREIRFDRLKFYELPPDLVVNERDTFIQKIFEDPQIVKERLKISVKNASEVLGLATKIARFIENIGGEVVEVENSKLKLTNPKLIVYAASKDSPIVKRLEDILKVKAEWVRMEETQRADVEVVVTH